MVFDRCGCDGSYPLPPDLGERPRTSNPRAPSRPERRRTRSTTTLQRLNTDPAARAPWLSCARGAWVVLDAGHTIKVYPIGAHPNQNPRREQRSKLIDSVTLTAAIMESSNPLAARPQATPQSNRETARATQYGNARRPLRRPPDTAAAGAGESADHGAC